MVGFEQSSCDFCDDKNEQNFNPFHICEILWFFSPPRFSAKKMNVHENNLTQNHFFVSWMKFNLHIQSSVYEYNEVNFRSGVLSQHLPYRQLKKSLSFFKVTKTEHVGMTCFTKVWTQIRDTREEKSYSTAVHPKSYWSHYNFLNITAICHEMTPKLTYF